MVTKLSMHDLYDNQIKDLFDQKSWVMIRLLQC